MSDKKVVKDGFTQEEWLELCEYVENDILNYDKNQKAPRSLYLRMRGLSKGQFIANNNIKVQANYSYKIILITFKYSLLDIRYAMSTKSFKNEQQRINYIMAIVENNINDVYLKLAQTKKDEEKTKNYSLEDNYKPKMYYKKEKKKESIVEDVLGDNLW